MMQRQSSFLTSASEEDGQQVFGQMPRRAGRAPCLIKRVCWHCKMPCYDASRAKLRGQDEELQKGSGSKA